MLYKKKRVVKIDKVSKKIFAILSKRETQWNEVQKQKLKEKLELKLEKAIKAKDYVKKLLTNCKSWRGQYPSSAAVLQQVIKENPDKQKTIVRIEIAFYSHTHKSQKIAQTRFISIGIPHEKKLINLAILLDDDVTSSHTMLTFLQMMMYQKSFQEMCLNMLYTLKILLLSLLKICGLCA